jgi:hypothetical protein
MLALDDGAMAALGQDATKADAPNRVRFLPFSKQNRRMIASPPQRPEPWHELSV